MDFKQTIKNNLRRVEHIFQTDMVYLAKFGSILVGGNVISGILSFIASVAFARYMSKGDYGNYRLVVAAIGSAAILALPGLTIAVQKAVAQSKEKFLATAVRARLQWGWLASLAIAGIGAYYYFQGQLTASLFVSFTIAVLFFPFMEASKLYSSYLNGKKLFAESTSYGIITQVIYTGMIVLTLILKPAIVPIVAVLIIGNTALNWFFHFRTIKKFPPNDQDDSSGILYAKRLTLASIIPVIAKYADSFLSFTFLGPVALANYSFATIPTDKLGLFTNPILSLAFPKFAQRSREELRQSIYWKWFLMTLLCLGFISIFILILPFIYRILFPRYIEVVVYAQLYALTALTTPNGIILTAFQAQGMIREITQIQIFASVIQIVLMGALVIPFGLWGLVWANIITVFAKSVVFLLLARRI